MSLPRRPMIFALPALVLLAVVSAAAQQPPPSKFPVPVATYRVDPAGFRKDSTTLHVRLMVPKGWHIQSNAPLDEFLIPTALVAVGKDLRFGNAVFPKPVIKELEALGGKVALFEDTVNIRLPVRRLKPAGDPKVAALSLRYQACNDTQCLPPRTIGVRYEGP